MGVTKVKSIDSPHNQSHNNPSNQGDKMKKYFASVGVFISLVLMFSSQVGAQSNYPDYSDLYVNDLAEVLDNGQESQIRNVLSKLNTDTGVEATVLTVDSIQGFNTGDQTIESFSTNLFNDWGIGDSELNNGILLLLAIEERGVRIETGVGWESCVQVNVVGGSTADVFDT